MRDDYVKHLHFLLLLKLPMSLKVFRINYFGTENTNDCQSEVLCKEINDASF
jgi:hypothetical protein